MLCSLRLPKTAQVAIGSIEPWTGFNLMRVQGQTREASSSAKARSITPGAEARALPPSAHELVPTCLAFDLLESPAPSVSGAGRCAAPTTQRSSSSTSLIILKIVAASLLSFRD